MPLISGQPEPPKGLDIIRLKAHADRMPPTHLVLRLGIFGLGLGTKGLNLFLG